LYCAYAKENGEEASDASPTVNVTASSLTFESAALKRHTS
jgi:hypothetical protein